MKDVLLIFARYPEVGKCKTRLIGSLGAQAATDLHESMLRHTLNWARRLRQNRGTTIVVYFAGGDRHLMASRFGDDLEYVRQGDGDLGCKLKAAVENVLTACAARIVVVGTDCPELNETLVEGAFDRLETHTVCIAPASDGGYTLLGLTATPTADAERLLAQLFDNVPWGTPGVMRQTAQQLSHGRVIASLLPTLHDVDLPEDLPRGQAALDGVAREPPELTIVIPTLGTGKEGLARAIAGAAGRADVEVIVVAAGETHEVLPIAAKHQTQLISSAPGRGRQMNAGARLAEGQLLVFLHADTELPPDFVAALRDAFQRPEVVGGAFALRIDSPRASMRAVERGVRLRSNLLQLPYGDQAIFVRTPIFRELGGYREQPIMEDYDFIRRLKRVGKLALLTQPVITSARRWERLGAIRTTCINQLMLLGFHAGLPLEKLAAFYRRQKSK